MLRGKFITLNTFLRKKEKYHINNPIFTVVACSVVNIDFKEENVLKSYSLVQRYTGSNSRKNTALALTGNVGSRSKHLIILQINLVTHDVAHRCSSDRWHD